MKTSEMLVFNTLIAAPQFLDEHAATLGGIAGNGARRRLDVIVAALRELAESHTVNKVSASALVQSKTAVRRTLVQDHLGSIAAAARAVLAETPELAVARSVPPINTSTATLVNRARDVSAAVAPFTEVLVAAGLPSDFLATLDAGREVLESVTVDRFTSLKKTRGARVGIREQLSAGRRQVRILDRLVSAALRGEDGALLTEWKGLTAYPRTRRAVPDFI